MIAAYAQLAASMMLVGANVPVGKLLAAGLPVPVILFLRCALACVLLAPFRRTRPGGGDALNLTLQALFGTVFYNVALLAGLRRTGALEAGLLLATLPAVVAIGAALFLGERLTRRVWLAVLLAVGGMAALTAARPAGFGTLAGDALVILAVCGEAGYVLLAKSRSARLGIVSATFWMQAASAALMLPFVLPVISEVAFTPSLTVLLGFHSLTASLLAVLLWYGGVRLVPAATAGVFTGLLPLTAGVLAVVLLGETVTGAQLAAGGLLLASIALATWPDRPQ